MASWHSSRRNSQTKFVLQLTMMRAPSLSAPTPRKNFRLTASVALTPIWGTLFTGSTSSVILHRLARAPHQTTTSMISRPCRELR